MRIYEATTIRLINLMKENNLTPNGLAIQKRCSQATVKSIMNGEAKTPALSQ